LDTFLKDDLGRSRLGSFQRRLQVASDVLTAIRFLHAGSKDKRIGSCFHRDIKSANTVIKGDFTAQLIDCGLAKFVNDNVKTTGGNGTKGYMCPEYFRTGRYSPACDLYSFGVVLFELWTGRLQNHEDDLGTTFNFEDEYIHQRRDAMQDADVFMDMNELPPKHAMRYTQLALKCISERSVDRTTGEVLFMELKGIFKACLKSGVKPRKISSLSSTADSTKSGATEICSTCRTELCLLPHDICATCLVRKEGRETAESLRSLIKNVAANLSKQIEATNATVCKTVEESKATLSTQIEVSRTVLSEQIEASSTNVQERIEDARTTLSKQIEKSDESTTKELAGSSAKLDSMSRVLAHLDRRVNHRVPRMFVLFPADKKSLLRIPKSWFLDIAQKKYYLFFVCTVTHQAVSSPVKLTVPKEWIQKIAPVLAISLCLVQIAAEVVRVSVPLDDVTNHLFEISSKAVEHMQEGLSALLADRDPTGLVDRLRTKKLTAHDVEELNGAAYEIVVEKADDPNQRGWRLEMEPVRVPPSEQVFWVSTKEAADLKYQIVK
jgi:serine/threonine protein kinase